VGIHDPGVDTRRVKNTVIWINENGAIAHHHQKIHLFDIDIKDRPVLKESKSFICIQDSSSIVLTHAYALVLSSQAVTSFRPLKLR